MTPQDLIGRVLKDILVWYKYEVGGIDEAEVVLNLDNGATVKIPWDLESKNIETTPKENSESLFLDLSDQPIYYVNPERKSIFEIAEAKRKRERSLIGRIKKLFGFVEEIPKEYRPYKIEYTENKLKFLKEQKIVNFYCFDDSESVGFLQLENGNVITETSFAPHGTGLVGLNLYENIQEFEESCGTDYQKLI